MRCPICLSDKTSIVTKEYTGYVEGTFFDIYLCSECDTQFIPKEEVDSKLYDLIYSNSETPGYSRYYKYAEAIKSQNNPLQYLAQQESTYFPIYDFVKDKQPLDILDIGCGYGYVTYALNSLGHRTTGIDISQKAIEYCKEHFGDYYINTNISSLITQNRTFDLIIATELIEHLADINDFIKQCADLLKENGTIIITTPNKDFYKNRKVCQTDLPPVHLVALGKKSIKYLANKHNLDYKIVDFREAISEQDNLLFSYLKASLDTTPLPTVDKDGRALKNALDTENSWVRSFIKKIVLSRSIRILSNKIGYLLTKEHPTLAVEFNKHKD